MKVARFDSREMLDAALAQRLRQALEVQGGGVMLAGGRTPQQVYERLGAHELHPAANLSVLYSDERYVPAESPASNYRASLPLLRALALPANRVLSVRTELKLEEAAADYEKRLRERLDDGIRINLGLLGLGTDGHTASLFSPADLDRARGRLVIAVQRPDGMSAVTVTPQFMAQLAQVIFVVAGADKREVLKLLRRPGADLIATRAVAGCRNVEVWCDDLACADG